MEESESEDFGVGPSIISEAAEVVTKLHSYNAPENKFLKALDAAGLSWLTHI